LAGDFQHDADRDFDNRNDQKLEKWEGLFLNRDLVQRFLSSLDQFYRSVQK
jgi:hypothetical protein